MCSDYKYHFVYKTVNNLNGDYYYGVHQTDNLNDGYIGSGLRLKRAINKYGRPNFTRTIVKYFDNRNDALQYEYEVLDDKKLNDIHCYNIACGGHGGNTISGFTEEERKKFSDKLKQSHTPIVYTEEVRKKMSEAAKGRKPWNKGKPCSEETKEKLRQYKGEKHSHFGKHLSDETKKKISDSHKGKKLNYNVWNKGNTNIYSEEYRKKLSDSHKGKHWKLVDGKRVWY